MVGVLLMFSFQFFAQDIKVMTYNIRLDAKSDSLDNWHNRKAELVAFLNLNKADFYGLQEVLHDQLVYIDSNITSNYSFIGIGRDDGLNGGEYSPIFYDSAKWRLIKQNHFWLSPTSNTPSIGWDAAIKRICTNGVFVNANNDTIQVFNTHFDHRGLQAREESSKLIAQKAINSEHPCLILGDFNVDPRTKPYEIMTDFFVDSKLSSPVVENLYEGTFNGFKLDSIPSERIDYIFTDPVHWMVKSYLSIPVKNTSKRQLSDHDPVMINCSLIKSPLFQYRLRIIGEDTLRYRIIFPSKVRKDRKYPTVLFFHGSGERGSDNERQLIHAKQFFIDSVDKYGICGILPQCPSGDYWASVNRTETPNGLNFEFLNKEKPNQTLGMVINLINELQNHILIDANRLYAGGLSMGGMATWELLWRMPNTFAAAIPICGGGFRENVKNLKTPIWAFHGTKDTTVRPWHTTELVTAIQQSGGKAKISLYPGIGHNSWSKAFKEIEIYKWLLSKNLKAQN
jgi:endonuclease/exonuclease/phosphatase family metal-dependent hydrolase/predicted esterase